MVMEMAVTAAGAMIYVNTVVLVQAGLGLGAPQVALAFVAFGAGSIVAAFLLPRILEKIADRPVMIAGAGVMVAGVALTPLVAGIAVGTARIEPLPKGNIPRSLRMPIRLP